MVGCGRLTCLGILATGFACASLLGVDHDYRWAEGTADPGVRCADGGTYCTPSLELCCLHAGQGSACVAAGPGLEPCQGYTPIRCDDPADCGDGGLACCISLNPQQYLLETRCDLQCTDQDAAASEWLALCDPSAPASCASGTTCQPLVVGDFASQPGWFHACQP